MGSFRPGPGEAGLLGRAGARTLDNRCVRLADVLPAGGYPAYDDEVVLRCGPCGDETRIVLPRLVDWRDRRRLERLRAIYPTAPCHACGGPIEVSAAVAVWRPGDPVRLLVGVPVDDPDPSSLVAALEVVARPDGTVDPFLTVEPQLLAEAADRYTGFYLTRTDDPTEADEIATWARAVGTANEWPRRADRP